MNLSKLSTSTFWSFWILLIIGGAALAQQSAEPDPCAAAAGCGVCGSVFVVPIIIIALDIALLIWVARDAKSRGMDNAVMWMILVFFTSVIGLLIYISSRPQGNLMKCASCGNNRLQVSAKCPHCGNI
jgi:uncharacterized membrane protein YhaH (DUF805 family)